MGEEIGRNKGRTRRRHFRKKKWWKLVNKLTAQDLPHTHHTVIGKTFQKTSHFFYDSTLHHGKVSPTSDRVVQ